jgi:hypothetical protein
MLSVQQDSVTSDKLNRWLQGCLITHPQAHTLRTKLFNN